jgi:predicted GIY-YIG superfamily endonuclease
MPETENGVTAWVYILSCDDGDWYFGACDGALSDQLQRHDRCEGGRSGMGKSILLWAQSAENLLAAERTRDAIAAWPDAKQEALVRGEIEPPDPR